MPCACSRSEALQLTPARRYGYQTNSRVKFVISFALAEAVIRDVDVKMVRALSCPT
jgi:hypothetical protein